METNTFLRGIDATTGAAAPILVSMEGYVGRFGILKAPGFNVPVLTYTLVSGVRRRCKDIAKNGASTSGKYDIFDSNNKRFSAHYDLQSEPGFVSALKQSFSLGKKVIFAGQRVWYQFCYDSK